ncbi:UNVERIFIED_CONTAM: hypothetical protein ABIC26_003630 [Paenibacillus sp. PvR008]
MNSANLQADLKVRVSEFIYEQIQNKSFAIPMNDVGEIEYFFKFTDQDILTVKAMFPVDCPRFEDEQFDEVFTKSAVTRLIFRSEFDVMIHNFFLAFQIADPAGFDIVHKTIYVDEKESYAMGIHLHTPFAVEELYENEVFENLLEPLNVEIVLDWLIKQKDFWGEIANSKTGTALNYLRYYFENKSPLGTLWLCMALESLLVENQNFSKNQIYGKMFFLTEGKIDKDMLKGFVDRFYSFRSKIVHGKLNLYRPTLIHDADDEVNKLDDSINSNETFGVFSLFICLHFMINNGMHALNFEEQIVYKLK